MSQDFIKTELAKYNLPDAAIAKMKEEYLPLVVKDPEDIESYMLCKEKHQEVKKVRIAIENKRKDLKADSLKFGQAVDTEAKRLTSGVKEIEDHLQAQRAVVEDEKKRQKEEEERQFAEAEARVKREEEDRLEAQRKEQEEKARELEEKEDAFYKEQAEKERKIQEDRDKIEADKKAIEDEKERIEREKRHAEEVEKAKIEAAELAKKQEKERIEQEAKDKEDAEKARIAEEERQKQLAPDKEKITLLRDVLVNLPMPTVKDVIAKAIIDQARIDLDRIANRIEQEAKKL